MGGGDGLRHVQPVTLENPRTLPRHGPAQRVMLCRVQFGQRDPVMARAQAMRGNQGRAGISIGAMRRTGRRQRAAIGVVGRKHRFGPRDSRGCLACFYRFRCGQIIQAAPRMGFNVGQRFVLGHHVIQQPRQQRVFVHIGQVAGVKAMLVRQHRA